MAGALMTVELKPEAADLESAARQLGVETSALDQEFGVVPIAPEENLYSVMLQESASVPESAGDDYRGPFSNPLIEPFGPPE